jgi:hypothetical protein
VSSSPAETSRTVTSLIPTAALPPDRVGITAPVQNSLAPTVGIAPAPALGDYARPVGSLRRTTHSRRSVGTRRALLLSPTTRGSFASTLTA